MLDWMTAVGTILSSVAAVYFGAIRPNRQKAKLIIHNPTKALLFSKRDYPFLKKEADFIEVGFLVEQISGGPSRDVNILVKKIWYWDPMNTERKQWTHFVPSNLMWASKESPIFASGVQRYCYLGAFGESQENDYVGRVFNLSITENIGDPFFDTHSSMLPSVNFYEIELMVSGENVEVSEFKIALKLYNPSEIGEIGPDGLPSGGSIEESVEVINLH